MTTLLKYLLGISFLLSSSNSMAQYVEIGLFGGAISFDGDVNKGSLLSNTQPAFGAFVRYNINPHITTRINFHKGTLQADDNNSSDLAIRQRNFSFQSDLIELSVMGELNILPFVPDDPNHVFAPYLWAGIGVCWFDPTTNYQGKVIHLQTIGTEGQGLEGNAAKYGLMQLTVPLGIGLKYALSPRIHIGIEIGYRYTTSDYIDDVSTVYLSPRVLQQNGDLAVALSNRTAEYTGLPANDLIGARRGNSNNKDSYLLWGVHLSASLYRNNAYRGKKRNFKITKWF